jgi:hypothetical protein
MEQKMIQINQRSINLQNLESIINICNILMTLKLQRPVDPLEAFVAILSMNYNTLLGALRTTPTFDALITNFYGGKYKTNEIKLIKSTCAHGYPIVIRHNDILVVCISYKNLFTDLQNATNFELITQESRLKIKEPIQKATANEHLDIERLEAVLDNYKPINVINQVQHNPNNKPTGGLTMVDYRLATIQSNTERRPENVVNPMEIVYNAMMKHRDTFKLLHKLSLILNQAQESLDSAKRYTGTISISLYKKLMPVLG